MLPGLAWYTFIVFVPVILAIYYGFFEWSGGTKKLFVGFENFMGVIRDPVFQLSLKNNIFLTVVCLLGQIGIAFILAFLLSGRHVVFKGFHRTMSYFPAVLSAVIVGFIWSLIYDYNYGLLNTLLRSVGLGDKVQA